MDAAALALVSRWVTPEEAPTRYDTRFYLAGAQDAPEIRIANDELVEHLWVAPGDALVMHAEGTLEMFLPTIAHLRWLERRSTVDDAVAAAQGADGRSLVEPEAHGRRQLAAHPPPARDVMRIQRILAGDPGPFTGPGTNTWLVDDAGGCVVIDPGPIDDFHRDRILERVAGLTVIGVLVTHTHSDHAPLANPLARELGVPAYGYALGPISAPIFASGKAPRST